MGKVERQNGGRGIHRRLGLLVVLLLLVGGWAVLIVRVPMLLHRIFPTIFMDRESGTATLALSNRNVLNPWSQEISFDVQSGSLDWKMARKFDDTFFHSRNLPNPDGYRIVRLDRQLTGGKYRLIGPPGSGVPDRDFHFPHSPYPVNDKYAVCGEADELMVMAFADRSSEIKKTKVGGVAIGGGIRSIDGADAILGFQKLPTLGNPPSYQVRYLSIDDDLAVTPGRAWQAIELSTLPYENVANVGDQLVSINPTNYEMEFRDSSNGKLIESMALLDGTDPVTMNCNFWPNYLRIEPTAGSPRFFDLRRRQWLPLISGVNFSPSREIDDRYILFTGGFEQGWVKNSKIFDLDQQSVISDFKTHVRTEFIDNEAVLDLSFASGLTFRKIDFHTGETLQTWKPFWWVIPSMGLLCVGWLIWSWCWLNGSQRSSDISIWIDVILVAVLPIVLCIIRLKYIGDIGDLSRAPTQVAQGIIVALMLSGVVWLVHRRVRIVPRVLPFILASAVLAASISITYAGQLEFVIPDAIKAMVPVSVFFACFFVLGKCGYRLVSPDVIGEPRDVWKSGSVTIRDMFVLMAALAILFAGLSPWLPSVSQIYRSLSQVFFALFFFSVLSLVPVLGWCLALSEKRFRVAGDFIFLTAFVFSVASIANGFAGESSLLYTLFGIYPTVEIMPTFCFVATYWIALCFRLRGWKFGRALHVEIEGT